MKKFLSIFTSFFLVIATTVLAAEPKSADHHEEHEEHQEHDEHDESESAAKSLKLSAEAIKTIGYKTQDFKSSPMLLPKKAVVRTKNEKSIFVVRDGAIYRLPVTIKKAPADQVSVSVTDAKAGDQIVITEVGFLRMAEVFGEGGVSHGHAH